MVEALQAADWWDMGAAFALGWAVGAVYFWGLWLTLRMWSRARASLGWLALGALVRMLLLLGAVYFIGADDWQRMVAAVVGVIVARLVLTRALGPARISPARKAAE